MTNYPIRIIITVCLTIIIFAIAGCDRHSGASEKLNLAESLMDSKPDSALSILNAVNVETLNGKKDKARYALLKSMALDKNYIDTTSLDILQPAIDYYLRKGTADEKLRTYYYQGRIYQNRENNDSAMQSFMRGREYCGQASDTLTMANLLVAQGTILYTTFFLPICGLGLWYGEPDPFHNTSAAYWTGSEDPEYGYNGRPIEPSNVGKSFAVERDAGFTGATSLKAYGLNIRAVVNPKEAGIGNIVSENEKVRMVYRNGCVHISGSHPEGIIKVFDLSGRMTYSGSVVDSICQLPELADGIYLISYADKGSIITTQKLTIK